MPFPNEHACRLENPDNFIGGSFRRLRRKSKEYNKTYGVIQGRKKSDNKMADQAYRYKKQTWETAQARSHCRKHGGSFEAASDS